MALLRQLNQAAFQIRAADTTENRQEFDEIHELMKASLDQMVTVAGKEIQRAQQIAGQVDTEALWKNDFFGPP
jgi:hypothetical protein